MVISDGQGFLTRQYHNGGLEMTPIKNVGDLKKFLEAVPDSTKINLCILKNLNYERCLHVGDSGGTGIGAIVKDSELELHATQEKEILL